MEQKSPSPITKSLAFVGDIFIPEKVKSVVLSAELTELLSSCEVRSCNLEAPLQGYGSQQPKVGPHLCQSVEAPAMIERMGFNLINTANNHIFDYGDQALKQTLNAFHCPTVGAGMAFNEIYRPYIDTESSPRIAYLSFGEAEFGACVGNENGFAWVNHPYVNHLIQQTKTQCDVLIVQVHAGVERIELPLPEWRVRYRELIDWGADAVIASHPHVPQGWEVYKDKPICYSLGDFFFVYPDAHLPVRNRGLVVKLNIHSDLSLSFQCFLTEQRDYTVGLADSQEGTDCLMHLCDILREPTYTRSINRIALTLWDQYYRSYYEKAVNGVPRFRIVALLKFFKRLLCGQGLNLPLLIHNNRIESHLWIVRRALSQLYQKERHSDDNRL